MISIRMAVCAAFATMALSACDLSGKVSERKTVAGGNAERGHALIARGDYGCTACHSIPGAAGIRGNVGPPLAGFARRALIAGQIPNEPENLVGFLYDPPAYVPRTGMPELHLSLADARDVAAYLYTLQPQ